jgi:hypothetical protein
MRHKVIVKQGHVPLAGGALNADAPCLGSVSHRARLYHWSTPRCKRTCQGGHLTKCPFVNVVTTVLVTEKCGLVKAGRGGLSPEVLT